MSSNSAGRPLLRLGAVAAAVVMGAGGAFAYVVTSENNAVAQPEPDKPAGHGALLSSPAAPTAPAPATTTTTPPPPEPILPFNAKLASQNIPEQGGGVRRGGCSGSLVAPDWIITAGHCFHNVRDVRISGKPPYTMTVTIGKLKDSDPGGHTAEVIDVRQSPVNDIALAKLSAPVADIAPLTVAESRPAVGQKLQFAGWGSLSATVIAPSDHLKRGDFKVAKINQSTLEAEPLVTRTVENSPCPEDSGAPFFISDDNRTGVLVAIVSTGPSCPQPGREIIARVDVVADWIKQQTSNTTR